MFWPILAGQGLESARLGLGESLGKRPTGLMGRKSHVIFSRIGLIPGLSRTLSYEMNDFLVGSKTPRLSRLEIFLVYPLFFQDHFPHGLVMDDFTS